MGILSPASRGSLLNALIGCYVGYSLVSGYVSARLYKMMGGEKWRKNTLITSTLVPGSIFGIFTIMNFFMIGEGASNAVPFGTFIGLVALWFALSIPLCFLGSYFGFLRNRISYPVRTNHIPRQIPAQKWYNHPLVTAIYGGLLPFGAIYIELYYILNSVWYQEIYYVFGVLFLVYTTTVLTCALISCVLVYLQLCGESYHWWWRSVLNLAAAGLYLFGYSIYYQVTSLRISNFATGFTYYGWSLIISSLFAIVCGSVGTFSALIFNRLIYATIKID